MISYKDSGVDIDEGNALVEGLKPLVKSTFDSNVIGMTLIWRGLLWG